MPKKRLYEINYPFVSFILPMKNEEKHVAKVIESILNLNYPKNLYEILVIDDGSMDASVKIAQQYGVIIIQARDKTIAQLRNIGARESKGELYAFVDTDCVLHQEWLKIGVFYLKDPKTGIVGNKTITDNSNWYLKTISFIRDQDEEVATGSWIPTASFIVKKTIFNQINGFKDNLVTGEDVDFGYRAKKYCQILLVGQMKSVHLGEDKNLIELFNKEIWRGSSNINSIKTHGIVKEEIPSLLVPVYGLLLGIGLCSVVIKSFFLMKIDSVIILLLLHFTFPACLYSLWLSLKKQNFRYFLNIIVVRLVYQIGRSIGLVKEIGEEMGTKGHKRATKE